MMTTSRASLGLLCFYVMTFFMDGYCATHYVSPTGADGASGSSSAPWRTITKAAATLVAGDTAIIRNGTYEEPSISFENSGTANNPIVFRAQNKHAAILSSTSGCDPALSLSASYISIEDLRISVSSGNPCGIYTSASAALRAWGGSVGAAIRGCLVDYSDARSTGIKTNQDSTVIENNIVHSEIEAFNTNWTIIRGNTLYDGGPNGTFIVDKGGARNTQICNNVIHINRPNGASGILIGGSSSCCWWDENTHIESYNAVAYNNVIINETNSTSVGLMGMWGAQNGRFYNNIGINGQIFLYLGSAVGYEPLPKCINPVFMNNILIGSGGTVTSGLNGWDGYWEGTLTVDYNNFYGYGSGVPNQAHTVTGDPKFVNNNSDWHLQSGSPCIGAGTPATLTAYGGGTIDISKDIDGVTRTIPWDLGIYAKIANPTIRLTESGLGSYPIRGNMIAALPGHESLPIRDILGRIVGSADIAEGFQSMKWNVPRLGNGIYFIENKPCLLMRR